MTEVDAALPESVALPHDVSAANNGSTAALTATSNSSDNNDSSTNTKTTTIPTAQQLKEEQKQVTTAAAPTPTTTSTPTATSNANNKKDADIDTEEDDSQITSSTDNGGVNDHNNADVDADTAAVTKKPTPPTSAENSKASAAEQDNNNLTTTKSAAGSVVNANDDSSNACDGVSQTSQNSVVEKSGDEAISAPASAEPMNVDTEGDGEGEGEGESSVDSSQLEKQPEETATFELKDINSTKADDTPTPMDASTDDDPLQTTDSNKLSLENGAASSEEQKQTNSIVSLDDSDDDDDVEMPQVPTKSVNSNQKQASPANTAADSKTNLNKSMDSDGAFVIGSDSESESNEPAAKSSTATKSSAASSRAPVAPQVIDDDDDDCVVIEDDTPPQSANDLSKRKDMDGTEDNYPASKRARIAMPPNNNSSQSQLTIKDARSLLNTDTSARRSLETGVYPVNITPAQAVPPVVSSGPPKLVPMTVGNTVITTAAIPPLPNMNTIPTLSGSTNLLPGLTDDMFVLEAPSFIVPYIYEKPPSVNLKDIVKEIETKFKLTKEDLAEVDKSDEFDMMTEQNKPDAEAAVSTEKKKKRRGGADGDDSWSEESEEDDDDDDSESGMRTKVLIKEASDDLTALQGAIKPAAAVVQSPSTTAAAKAPGQENYFESPLGKFFMDIGVGQVQEYVQADLIRLQKRKMRKSFGSTVTEFERAIAALSVNLETSKKKNAPFKFTMKRCEFCNFKSESALSMANHYETPHMNGIMYRCNFCTYEIRNATEIVYHMEAVHNIKARLIKPLPYHQCPNCGFEDNGKAKLARHQPVCAKKFRPEVNLAPPNDWEAPAKIPRIKPRHGLVGTATAYQAMAAQAAAQKAAIASIQQQQQQAAQARSIQAAALAAQNAAKQMRARAPVVTKPPVTGNMNMIRNPSQIRGPMPTNVVLPNNYQMPQSGAMMQAANALAAKTLTGQPSISITPLPRQNAAAQPTASTSTRLPVVPNNRNKPGPLPPAVPVAAAAAAAAGNKAQFVICEICDGYIKDLEQLRNHMQWMHKVKIHPKMIYNRPPLNCQKCQFRFFTDQGLERHLLGSHGLVTSSMQEAANKGKDAGRCPVCGRMYQWKLLNHVSRDHHMTLKPAHLSYKCTVCTATFGMYKQFETHVYTAHSNVAKKAMDGKKATPAAPSAGGSSNTIPQRHGLNVSNDSLLKPLKINDEITIIPQPASKSRSSMTMDSHVID